VGAKPPLAGVADPPPWRVDHPREADLVGGVDEQVEVSDRVLDLGPLVELRPPDHLVGQLVADEDVLEHPAVRVGSVEDRDLLAADLALAHEALDLAGDIAGLGVLVLELGDRDLLAFAEVGPKVLLADAAVVGDHRIRRREDRLGGAVVLLQLQHRCFGEVVLKLEDVADVGPSKAINCLRVVADHRQVPISPAEQLEQPVLGVVGVLVLVDEDPAEALAVAAADVLEQLEHGHRPHQQVVEVHRVRLEHPALVEAVGLADHLLERPAPCLLVGLRVDQLVLRVRDPRADRPRWIALGVDLELLEAALQHPQRVGLVVDRELAGVAEPLGLDPQQPGAGGVEGHHPHPPLDLADERGDPLAHLVGGLVGEGDREDLVRPRLARREQPGDPVGEHPGLARPGAGQHQQRPLAVGDRLPLGLVEVGEQALELVGARLHRRAEGRGLLYGAVLGRLDLLFLLGSSHKPSITTGPAGSAARRGRALLRAELGHLGGSTGVAGRRCLVKPFLEPGDPV
jgi:hypothetical protein